ncbi:putative protein kinase CAMK-CDPK family [Helianthus anomalus]
MTVIQRSKIKNHHHLAPRKMSRLLFFFWHSAQGGGVGGAMLALWPNFAPHYVQPYNAFEDDSYIYIAMELCEGGELLDRIFSKKDSRYTEKDAAIIVRQMLKVAAQCHLHGLVHRDMKPENFLFKSTKEDSPLKAVDFGLSDFIRPGKKFIDIVGRAYYVAPEVLKRKSGPASDVWSIGVITYILHCGRRPFWDKTEDGIFKEVFLHETLRQSKKMNMLSTSDRFLLFKGKSRKWTLTFPL